MEQVGVIQTDLPRTSKRQATALGMPGVNSDGLENAGTWFNFNSGSPDEGFAARSTLRQLISKIKYKMLQA